MKGRELSNFNLVNKELSKIWIVGVILVCIIMLSLITLDIYRVKGNSMFNTIKQGDTVLILKSFKSQSTFQESEIVLFNTEINNEIIPYVKRITAVPKDTITANSDELIVNGKSYPHDEIYYLISENAKTEGREYLKYLMDQSFECREVTKFKTETISFDTIISIPNGCYFLIGDNPYESMDSRFFGLIHEDHIIGKVVAVF